MHPVGQDEPPAKVTRLSEASRSFTAAPATAHRPVPFPVIDHDEMVSALVHNLSTRLTSGASLQYRRRFGLGMTEWRMMALLAKEPWITPHRICQVIGMDKAAVSRTMRALERRDLIAIRPHNTRTRSVELALTDSGVALHNHVVLTSLERERRLVAGLTVAEATVLVELLRRLHRAVPAVNAPVG
jgi:DNA-binding MarR family transcriptional regulator